MSTKMSDIDTTASEGEGRERKRRKVLRVSSSDESEAGEQLKVQKKKKIPVLPKPPVKRIEVRTSSSQSSVENDYAVYDPEFGPISQAEFLPSDVLQTSIQYEEVNPIIAPRLENINSFNSSGDNEIGFISQTVPSSSNFGRTQTVPSTSSELHHKIKASGTSHSDNFMSSKEFQSWMIRKIKVISQRLKTLEDHALSSKNIKEADISTVAEIMQRFPVSTEEELDKFETYLLDEENMKDTVMALRSIGGSDEERLVVNILKRCFTNAVAEGFSFIGAKKKKVFKTLRLTRAILEAARYHSKTLTEQKFSTVVSNWLRHAKQRKERIEANSLKQLTIV